MLSAILLTVAVPTGAAGDWQIVLPERPSAPLKAAADDLEYVLGSHGVARKLRFEVTEHGSGDESFTINANASIVRVAGGVPGAACGIYEYIDRGLGFRFAHRLPVHPEQSTLAAAKVLVKGSPAFQYRHPLFWEADDADWARRNRVRKLPLAPGWFAHTMEHLLPGKEHFEKHPEWYALYEGKREAAQPCFSNPDALKETLRKLREWLAANPAAEMVSVSQNDTAVHCQCAACSALAAREESPAAPLLGFVNSVADELSEEYPNLVVDTLAYMWSEQPPKTLKPRPNVQIRLAMIESCLRHALDGCYVNLKHLEHFRGWAKIAPRLVIWQYGTNFSSYITPLPDLDALAANLRLYKRHGVDGVFYQGGNAPGGGSFLGALKSYVAARLMWDPSKKLEDVIHEYVEAVHPGNSRFEAAMWKLLRHKPEEHAFLYDPVDAPYVHAGLLADLARAAEEGRSTISMNRDWIQKAAGSPSDYLNLFASGRETSLLVASGQTAAQLAQSWQYRFKDGKYLPVRTAEYESSLARGLQGLRRAHVTEIREGEPLEDARRRLTRKPPQPDAILLQKGGFKAVVLPDPGGRLAELTFDGEDLVNKPSGTEEGNLLRGGMEQSIYGDRDGGWFEEYKVESDGTLVATLQDVEVKRNYDLAPGGLEVRLKLTNRGLTNVTIGPVTRISTPVAHIRLPGPGRGLLPVWWPMSDAISGKHLLTLSKAFRHLPTVSIESFPARFTTEYLPTRREVLVKVFHEARTLAPGESAEYYVGISP